MKKFFSFILFFYLLCIGFLMAQDMMYTMKDGDCLYNIALRFYKDPSLWRALKIYNSIGDVYSIPTGKVIKIPPKAKAKEIINGGTPSSTTTSGTSSSGTSSSSSSSSASSSATTTNHLPPYDFTKAIGTKVDLSQP